MKFESFAYTHQGVVVGFGCLIREKGKKNRILMPSSEDAYFPTREAAKRAGRDFIKSEKSERVTNSAGSHG